MKVKCIVGRKIVEKEIQIFTDQRLEEIWEKCNHNKSEIQAQIGLWGCFFCSSILNPAYIKEFTSDDAAICPLCHVDSILPLGCDPYSYPAMVLLKTMYQKYFDEIVHFCHDGCKH